MTSNRGSLGHQSTPVTPLNCSKPPVSFSTRQTFTMCSRATNHTGPSTAVATSTIEPGNSWSTVIAIGFCAIASGSTFAPCFFALAALLIRRPIQDSLFPDIEESAQNEHDEEQHLEKCKKFELPVNNCPRVKKNGFNVEQDEDHRDQVELHTQALARVPDWLHTRFVGSELDWIANTPPE